MSRTKHNSERKGNEVLLRVPHSRTTHRKTRHRKADSEISNKEIFQSETRLMARERGIKGFTKLSKSELAERLGIDILNSYLSEREGMELPSPMEIFEEFEMGKLSVHPPPTYGGGG